MNSFNQSCFSRQFPVPAARLGLAGATACAALAAWTTPLRAGDDEAYALPPVETVSTQVANQTPAVAVAMPVSGLRYEPRVDVQARNLTEAQADVTIRGGIFENTGFKVGALSLYDPQTGHYFAEIPIAPAMLTPPRVLTGLDNALAGFNAEVGTIAYGWRPIEQRGELSAGIGDDNTNRESLYQGLILSGGPGREQTIAADVELARSESDGSVPFGDHNFRRVAGRLQFRTAQSQTDFYAGGQRKFFGWPDLYTPFGVDETENLHTQLFLLNHRQWTSPDDFWELGLYYRRNYDDYEFDRKVPGEFNPYQHTTQVRGLSLEGRDTEGPFLVDYSLQAMRDNLRSTALTAGKFNSRDYYKISAVPERTFPLDGGQKVTVRAGATFDDTNRDRSAVSPVLEVALDRADGWRFYGQYAESTQVATYTALNSSPSGGLFRGNANLGRESSRNLETGLKYSAGAWSVESALFYRWDHDLVDWTYKAGAPTARSANPVDIGTFGAEVVAAYRTPRLDVILGATYLDKTSDYRAAVVDASFYALNFARFRATAAVVARPGAGFEVRLDNEFRVQEKNLLRTTGGNQAFRSGLGLYYRPPAWRTIELSAQVDNLWDSDFQEVPSVPAARRQYTVDATLRW